MVIRPMLLVKRPTHPGRPARGLVVWDNPCPSAGHSNRAVFHDRIRTLHGDDKMLKKNLFNALCKWQLALAEQAVSGTGGEKA